MGKQKRSRPTSGSSSHKKSKIDDDANGVCDPGLKRCASVLEKLMNHRHGWIFNEPVDVKALGLYDYYAIIRHPMDLGTIKTRLVNNRYLTPDDFAGDVRLTFHNAMTYNDRTHEVHIIAREMLNSFEKQWRDVRGRVAKSSGPADPEKAPAAKEAPENGEMTFDRKLILMSNLEVILPEKLETIVEIIAKRNPHLVENEQIEVDLDAMDTETLWELERLVIDCNKSLSKERKVEIAPANAEDEKSSQ